MFGDALQRFAAGDGLGTIRADTLNALIDSAKLVRQRLSKGATGGVPRKQKQGPGSLEILVQNETGGTLAEWSIVEVLAPLVDATVDPLENQERPAFSVIAPIDDQSSIAVLVEPIPDGTTGRAVVMGVAVVTLNVVDAGHTYCGPTAGVTGYLTTGETGPIRVLWKESGTGLKLGMVLMQGTGEGGTLTTANVDTTQESTTTRLEFDQDTGIRVDKGATDGDPDTVSLVYGATISVVTSVCPNLSVTKDGDGKVTGVSLTLSVERRTIRLPTGTVIGAAACESNPAACCDEATVDCCTDPVPAVLYVTISGGGSYPMTWNGANTWDTGIVTVPGCGRVRLLFNCDPFSNEWSMGSSVDASVDCSFSSAGAVTLTGCSGSAFDSWSGPFTAADSGGNTCGCAGTHTLTVTP